MKIKKRSMGVTTLPSHQWFTQPTEPEPIKCLTCYKIYENVFTFLSGEQFKIYTNIENLSSWDIDEDSRGRYTTYNGKSGRLKRFVDDRHRLYLIDRKLIKTCPCQGVYVESIKD